jgi:AcrR family transcriptional regulator
MAASTRDQPEPTRARRPARVRMRGAERREQLIEIARRLFADKGFEGTSVEEIAATAEVSKPVVYEHFGGKEGLYAVVVDREVGYLLTEMETALTNGERARELIEQAVLALLDYVETHTDGFRILVRDSSVASSSGSFASLLSDIASQVEGLLVTEFKRHGLEAKTAPMYAQMLVGMIALTGQWWLSARKPRKAEVAAHVVNLAWNGLAHLDLRPHLVTAG